MAVIYGADERQRRLFQMASEWGIPTGTHPGRSLPFQTHIQPPTPANPTLEDSNQAEELLKSHRLYLESQAPPQKRRIFSGSNKKKAFEPKELIDTLTSHVASGGSPSIAAALVVKLRTAAGDSNFASGTAPAGSGSKGIKNVLSKRRSTDGLGGALAPAERSRIIALAIENNSPALVAVLAPYADQLTLDDALPFALLGSEQVPSPSLEIAACLLQYGANCNTLGGTTAFRTMCARGGERIAALVAMVLRGPGARPSMDAVDGALVDAVGAGDLAVVLALTRPTSGASSSGIIGPGAGAAMGLADGSHGYAAALRTAIASSRVDLAMAILTGARPPVGRALAEAFSELFTENGAGVNAQPAVKLALTEAMLVAGADGDVVAAALLGAAAAGFSEMVEILVKWGANVEFEGARVVKGAVRGGQVGMVQRLLAGENGKKGSLGGLLAAECVGCIPKNARNEDRLVLLEMLLRKGAGGVWIDEALIDAVAAGDIESVKLLRIPIFRERRPIDADLDLRNGSGPAVNERHATASVAHRDGEALRIALQRADSVMISALLVGEPLPPPETMAMLFRMVHDLKPADRFAMAECILNSRLADQNVISSTLQRAIDERPRDERLVRLLLSHNADVNFDGGKGLLSAVEHEDIKLLETLLNGRNRPSPQTAAAAIPRAIRIEDMPVRAHIVYLLANAGAGRAGTEMAEALITVLKEQPVDGKLLDILVKQGGADVNFDEGTSLVLAMGNPDPRILEVLLQTCPCDDRALSRTLTSISSLLPSPAKTTKVAFLLRQISPAQQPALDTVLITEVQSIVSQPSSSHSSLLSSTIPLLLNAGANPNTYNASALCHAVAAAHVPLTDLILGSTGTYSLRHALPHALNIVDAMDRLSLTQKLLVAGAPSAEAARACLFAVNKWTEDVSLIKALSNAAGADMGCDVLRRAVGKAGTDVVAVVLAALKGTTMATEKGWLDSVFLDAVIVKDGDWKRRREICQMLLEVGVGKEITSNALIEIAAEGDVVLGRTLLKHGASVDHNDGKAVVEAAKAGETDILEMLLYSGGSKISRSTLNRAFDAAIAVTDLSKRAGVLKLLLDKGVDVEPLDKQLVAAVRYGDDGVELVKLLLSHGASTDFNRGEAVWTATRSGFLKSLALMLGVEGIGDHPEKDSDDDEDVKDGYPTTKQERKRPSQATFLRALKASWHLPMSTRLTVVAWLFRAGLRYSDELHVALHKATNEDNPSLDLITLFLDHGASPRADGCRALADAAVKPQPEILSLFLRDESIPKEDLEWTFAQAFPAEKLGTWLCADGVAVAKMLLAKGARPVDAAIAALIAAMQACDGGERDIIAREIVGVLLVDGTDVNADRGAIVQAAAKSGDPDIVSKVLARKPNSEAVSMAFPYVFDADLPEDSALDLIRVFADYKDGEERLDVMFSHPASQPILFRALNQHPRSSKIIRTLLDAGYYHDQMITAHVMPHEVDEAEQVSLLVWAILQPQKRISSGIIKILIEAGAKVNFTTSITRTTPLMLAIRNKRQDIVRELILAGAEVDVVDVTGNTPLTLATHIGGDLGTSIMANLLAAEPSKNDGSLQNAARELNMEAMKVLMEYGHDPDFPSPLHGGRSALAEICFYGCGSDDQEGETISAAKEKEMTKAMEFLIENGADLTLKQDGKSVLLLALAARGDPLATTRALLKAGMWKHVNAEFNRFSDEKYTYSPTAYLTRILASPSTKFTPDSTTDTPSALLTLLRANRAVDTFYAHDPSTPQPADCANLPPTLLAAHQAHLAHEARLAAESKAHALTMARTRELAATEDQITAHRAELALARAARAREADAEGFRMRAALEQEAFASRVAQERAAREQESAFRIREREAEVEIEGRKLLQAVEYEKEMGAEKENRERSMAAVRRSEREDVERKERESNQRFMSRLQEQKRLVDSQTALAGRVTAAGIPPRQIGYVVGEQD